MDRYLKNKNLINKEDQDTLRDKKVVILGCGGLGGYIIEMLARLGIGHLTIVDYDVFETTNLNRQINSTEKNLGNLKVFEVKKRIEEINSSIEVIPKNIKITNNSLTGLMEGHDLIIDALDSIKLKVLVEELCHNLGIPMIHGAIGGLIAQVAVSLPGDFILRKLYGDIKKGIESQLGNPSFTPALAASIEVSEALKVLLKKNNHLRGEILYIDLENNSFSSLKII